MKHNSYLSVILLFFAMLLNSCSDNRYDKAVAYIDQLSTEVVSATTEEDFDAVYNKIVALKSDKLINDLTDLSDNQKVELQQKMVTLTSNALAVKAILYVMPKDTTPTADDMNQMVKECIQKKCNTLTQPYGDVRTVVSEYYSAKE